MAKIYLSAAAHATDNTTKCPSKCGENIHCNAYMDVVEKRLKELGVSVKRGDKKLTGDAALSERVKEANNWKADLYYVAHTNAGGGRYSMTMCYNDSDSKKKAAVFHKYRKCVSSHKVGTRTDLYEINSTNMTCLYDELFFHDNATDCKWFHNGGMEKLAEETVHALCELVGVKYKAPVKVPTLDKTGFKFGDISIGVLALKEMLLMAKKIGIQPQNMNEDTGFGNGTKNAVNHMLKAWGYAQNGIAGVNFIKRLAAEIGKKF